MELPAMQMIFVHKHANESCLAEVWLISHSFALLSKFILVFPIAYMSLLFGLSFELVVISY